MRDIETDQEVIRIPVKAASRIAKAISERPKLLKRPM